MGPTHGGRMLTAVSNIREPHRASRGSNGLPRIELRLVDIDEHNDEHRVRRLRKVALSAWSL